MTPRAELIGMAYSPWTQRARWALAHYRVRARFVPYLPTVGEPWLRARLSRLEHRVVLESLSVPILIDGERVVHGSREIAEYVETSDATTLFPEGPRDSLERWLEQLEKVHRAGRILATRRLLADDEALLETLPPWPRLMRVASLPVARQATRSLLKKYGGDGGARSVDAEADHALRTLIRTVLIAAHDTLERHGVLAGEEFSFADICLCTALQFVAPHPGLAALPPRLSASFGDRLLASEFTSLLRARDRLVQMHFPRPR